MSLNLPYYVLLPTFAVSPTDLKHPQFLGLCYTVIYYLKSPTQKAVY